MNYTKSIFTVEEELSNNELLVYNVLTQSYFFVDASYKDKHWYNFEKSPIKEELIRGKFIVPIDYDEKSDLLGKLETISDYNNMLDLTLLLTTDCNMK